MVIFPLELSEEVDDCEKASHLLELNALLKFQWGKLLDQLKQAPETAQTSQPASS